MTSFCVQGGRGGQKGLKTCVHTNSILPKWIAHVFFVVGRIWVARVECVPSWGAVLLRPINCWATSPRPSSRLALSQARSSQDCPRYGRQQQVIWWKFYHLKILHTYTCNLEREVQDSSRDIMERASIFMQNWTKNGPRATFFGQKNSKIKVLQSEFFFDIFMILNLAHSRHPVKCWPKGFTRWSILGTRVGLVHDGVTNKCPSMFRYIDAQLRGRPIHVGPEELRNNFGLGGHTWNFLRLRYWTESMRVFMDGSLSTPRISAEGETGIW